MPSINPSIIATPNAPREDAVPATGTVSANAAQASTAGANGQPSVGEMLRRARLARGLLIEQVAGVVAAADASFRINEFVAAIERAESDDPGAVLAWARDILDAIDTLEPVTQCERDAILDAVRKLLNGGA